MAPHRRHLPADLGPGPSSRHVSASSDRSRSSRGARRKRESESEVGCCMKYSLFGFNVLLWLIGGLILFVGCFAFIEKGGLIDDIETVSHVPLDPSVTLIVLGSLVFVISFLGCVGSLRENICFLVCFASIISVLLIAEITTGVLAYSYRGWVKNRTNNFILQNIKAYRDDPDLQDIIDGIQTGLECCGGQTPDDWDNNMYFNCTGTDRDSLIPEACGVPFSCCKEGKEGEVINTQCGFGARREAVNFSIHSKGCVQKMETWLKENLVPIAGTVLFVLIVQVFGVFTSMTLRSDIKRQRSKWWSVAEDRHSYRPR